MRRTLGSALVVAAVLAAGACGDDDDDTADGETTSTTEAGSAVPADEAAYVEAIAQSSQDEDNISPEDSECFAQAYVDVVGLEVLQANVTPDEIREQPESDPADFGIDLDETQQLDLVTAIRGCTELGVMFAESLAEGFGDDDPATTGACLETGLDDVEVQQVLGLQFGDSDSQMSEPQATTFVDWLGGCYDLRQLLAAGSTEGAPADVAACLDAGLSDDLARRFWIGTFMDQETAETSPAAAELEAVATGCAGG